MRLSHRKVVLVGLFSARVPNPGAELLSLANLLEAAGAQVVGRLLQRRGVSRAKGPGGAKRMEAPLAATVIGAGKARELATLCGETGADLVVSWNELTERQRQELEKATGVQVQAATAIGLKLA